MILNDLCGIPLPSNYLPFLGVNADVQPAPKLPAYVDVLHLLGFDSKSGSGHYEVQLSNPLLTDRQETKYPEIQKLIESHDNELRKCWEERKYRLKVTFDTSLLNIPRTLVIVFGIGLFASLLGSRHASPECPHPNNAIAKSCQGQPTSCSQGVFYCSNHFYFGSACIMTCPGQGSEINWSLAGNTGQVIFCGSSGNWIGNWLGCVAYNGTDY